MPSQNNQNTFRIINALWFLSLVFSLACALSATLIQQWSRIYLQGTEERFIPYERARMRTYLQRGVRRFRLAHMVDAIPMCVISLLNDIAYQSFFLRLLHISLFLFFGGLIVSLYITDTTLARVILGLVIPCLVIYILLSALPVFYYDCPFKTPLSSVLSYITYLISAHRPRIYRRRNKHTDHLQWHPEKQSVYLTQLWAQDGSEAGAELDHTALRWTLLTLTDLRDLEQFMAALPALLQSDSSSTLTHHGGRTAQALLFGHDMLAVHLVRLLRSTLPLDTLALPGAESQRLEARAATCLRTVMLLSSACDGPTLHAPQDWPLWAIMYFGPVARGALALREHPDPDLAVLAQSTALLLARRALVAYRTFLDDIAQRATNAANASVPARSRAIGELRSRKPQGGYLLRALREILQGLAGGTSGAVDSTFGVAGQELLRGNLFAHLYGPNAHGSGSGAAGAAGGDGGADDMNALAEAARADLPRAKSCLAVLFMLAACTLPADPTGEETLNALAGPLAWPEPCPYTDQPDEAMMLLLTVRNAHGHRLTVLDADAAVARYLTTHDPRHHSRAQPPGDTTRGPANFYLRPRRENWGQGTL